MGDGHLEPESAAPEAELARRILAARPGTDAEAEAALYRCLAPRVRLYGRRHLRDDAAADDLMQHVMLMSILKLREGALREPHRIVSFVFGACRMTVLDLRRGALRREALLQEFGQELTPAAIAPAPQLDDERMARCLEALPERERTVVVHTFYRDEPAPVVATALGLTAGNIRVIRHRALQRLRSCMGFAEDA